MITIEKTTSDRPSYHFYFNTVYLGDDVIAEIKRLQNIINK